MFQDNISRKILYIFLFIIVFFILFNLGRYYFKENIIFYNFDSKNTPTVYDEFYTLSGYARDVKNIFINNKEYFLDENNNFNIKLHLYNGYNNFNFKFITKKGDIVEKNFFIYKK